MRKNEISCIDTAVACGKSEETLGNFDVTKFKIVSKLTEITEISSNVENFIVNQIKKTLSKLNISKLVYCLSTRTIIVGKRTQIWGQKLQIGYEQDGVSMWPKSD